MSDEAATHNAFTSPDSGPALPKAAMLNRLTDSLDFQAQALTLRSERERRGLEVERRVSAWAWKSSESVNR